MDGQAWETALDDVAQIEQAARRATDLTHQLLAFARREVIHPDVISHNDSVGSTRRLLRRSLGLMRAEAGRQFDPGLLGLFLGATDQLLAIRAAHPDPSDF